MSPLGGPRVALILAALVLASCSPAPRKAVDPGTEVRTIRIFQEKVEIADGLKRMADTYNRTHPLVHLEIETVGGGQDYDAALADRYQAGTLPDVFMSIGYKNLDPWVDLAEDLTDETWVSDLRPGTVDPVTRNGRIYGNPLAIEGYGFLYNKALFRQAGITELPNSLPTLEAACRKLKAAGIRPFSNGYAEWWVLSNHNFNVLLGAVPDHTRLVAALAGGAGPGPDAAVVEGWMDLLDLTVRYGPPDPTLTDYTTSMASFLAGGAAMVQQGNWVEPDVTKSAPHMEVGVLPMPLGSAKEERLPMGVPNFWVINKNSPLKGDAKAWLEWMRSDPVGRKFLLQELKVIPPYISLESEPLGALSAPFAEAWRTGKTLPWIFPLYQEKTKPVASAMRAYIEHKQSHREFWAALSQAWTNR